MVLDAVGIILIILFFIRGYRKGLIVAAFAIIAILLGIICSLKLSQAFASFLLEKGIVTSGWAQIVSYIVLFIGVVWLVRAGGKLIEKTVEAVWLGLFNNLAGGVIYSLMAIIVWSCCLWLGNQAHIFSPETIASSKTFPWFSPVAPWVFGHVGDLMPFAKNIFTELQHFFDKVNQQLPEHVGAH